MIKVKTFVLKNSGNPCHHERLDNQINSFLSENNVEVVDIKYSTAVSVDDGRVYWIPSAMLIYKDNKN